MLSSQMKDDTMAKPELLKLTLPPQFLGLLLLPAIVLVASEFLLSAFGDPNVDLGTVVLNDMATSAELTGRYRFLAVFFFYAACCVTAIALFAVDLSSHFTRRSMVLSFLGFLGLVAFSIIFSVIEPEWAGSFEAYELLGGAVFEDGLAVGNAPFCGDDRCEGAGAFAVMRVLLEQTNWMSALAVSAIILGMVNALAVGNEAALDTAEAVEIEGARLEAAQRRVKRYLYLAGLLLSVGMMMGLAWMKWPLDLLADEGQRARFGALIDSVALFRGSSYSVLILSFYMPVSLLLMWRIERFDAARQATGTQAVVASVAGFDIERIGTLDSFKAIVSIMAPVLASAVGSLFGPGLFV